MVCCKAKRLAFRGFTLVEIVIVAGIITIIVAIAVPTWFRQREISRSKACQENLKKISDAKEQYALEYMVPNGDTITYPDDLLRPPDATTSGQGFLKREPVCAAGGEYQANAIGTDPTCSIGSLVTPFEPHEMR